MIDIKKLAQVIKKEVRVLWLKSEHREIVATPYFIAKIEIVDTKQRKHYKENLLPVLVSIFEWIPNDNNKFLVYSADVGVKEMDENKVMKFFTTEGCGDTGEITDLLCTSFNRTPMQVFKFPNYFAFLNKSYFDMLDGDNDYSILSAGANSPVCFINGNGELQLMILPIKHESKTLKGMISA